MKASDKGLPQRSATSRVLLDVVSIPKTSNNVPVVKDGNQVTNVIENEIVGDMVTLIEAEDPDGDQLWYSFTGKSCICLFVASSKTLNHYEGYFV